MNEPEWQAYRCRIPAAAERTFDKNTCSTLTEVYHVAHVPEACRILEDNRIKAGLIGDESRLKKTRTSVCWLSANTWAYGSIYGNVQFKYIWEPLIKDKHVYWVEAMTTYSPHAYRFLITDRDLSTSKFVIPYDPSTSEGPLRYRKGAWYWNSEKTSEFMFDRDIALSNCAEISFIRHHNSVCRIKGPGCSDRDRTYWSTGAQTLAFVIGRNLTRARHCFLRPSTADDPKLAFTVAESLEELALELSAAKPNGPIKSPERSRAIVLGALLLYGSGQFDDAQDLARVLESDVVLKNAFEACVRDYMKVPNYILPASRV